MTGRKVTPRLSAAIRARLRDRTEDAPHGVRYDTSVGHWREADSEAAAMTDSQRDVLSFDGMDRRRHARYQVVRPCKVRDRRTLVFSPGMTADVSASGALLRIDRVRPILPGDEMEVAVAWTPNAVLGSDTLVRAVVKRVTPIDHYHQAVAVEFEAKNAATRAAA
jgi:hypothetical protein